MAYPKKIPTLLALFILFFAIGAMSFLIQSIADKKISSSPSTEPINLMITNVSDTSAKVIWQTAVPTTGLITISTKTNTKITAYDERDVTGKLTKYTTHSVPIKNLQPNTAYEMKISSDGKQFPLHGKPSYTLQTGPTIADTTVAGFEPSYGVVKTGDGKPAQGGLLVLTLEDSQPISTLITQSGSWIIPLNFIRTKDLSRYVPAKNQMPVTISVFYETQKTESLTDTDNDAPVPDMAIGSSYDFRNREAKQKTTLSLSNADSSKQTSVLGNQTITSPAPSKIGGVSITAPLQNASLVSNRPFIQGTGIPGKAVTITIGIKKPVTGKTTVGANGLWSFTPKTALLSGKQSVTITTLDEKNKPVALTATFTILKSGSQVLGDATPSATISTTATPSATATPASISAEPMPEPGGSLPTILLILLGAGMVAGGIVFLL